MDATPPDPDAMRLTLDTFLRDVLPELKLALGDAIDRENARSLPGRYARLLPETLLVAVLRPDAAEAIRPIAAEIEQELTNSCTRHGSLYDRVYRVQLRRAENREAPVFSVAAHAGQDLAPAGRPEAAADDRRPAGAAADAPAEPAGRDPEPTLHAGLAVADPDATRAEGMAPATDWTAGRWLLVVEDLEGVEQEVFRIVEPFTTVGRRSDDPRLRVGIALSEVPHLSRRQLALVWDGEDPAPGFRVYNLGLNPLHAGEVEIAGARIGRGTLDLDTIDARHSTRLVIDEPLRVGAQGPVLRIRELPAPADDPDATVFE